MNYYKLIYWITRADSIREFFDIFSNWALTFAIFSLIFYVVCFIGSKQEAVNDEDRKAWLHWRKYTRRGFWISCISTTILWFGYVATPTKRDALMIVTAGGALEYFTSDSIGKQMPKELASFAVNELKSAAADAKLEWKTTDAKTKVMDEVKNLSAAELIEKMKSDTNLSNIILNK